MTADTPQCDGQVLFAYCDCYVPRAPQEFGFFDIVTCDAYRWILIVIANNISQFGGSQLPVEINATMIGEKTVATCGHYCFAVERSISPFPIILCCPRLEQVGHLGVIDFMRGMWCLSCKAVHTNMPLLLLKERCTTAWIA